MRLLKATTVLAALLLTAADVSAQTRGNFENSWFWGAKAGINTFSTDGPGASNVPTLGIDWLITRKLGGLYVSADQSFFGKTVTTLDPASVTGTRRVKINDLRRVDFAGVVFPGSFGPVRPYAGLGAAISLIRSAVAQPDSAGGEPSQLFIDAMDKRTSRSSLLVMAGVQVQRKRTAFFVQESLMPDGGDFLIRNALSFFEVGLRYNFGSSIEGSR
jgi:opacity protein-like surface antigen